MNSVKITFYDSQIFEYGIKSGFFINESTCLLKEYQDFYHEDSIDAAIEAYPNYKLIADYTSGSFLNPHKSIKVFSKLGKDFLKFRAALPFSTERDIPFALIIDAGEKGYMSIEKEHKIIEMLFELSGYKMNPSQPIFLEISPLELIIILSASDVVLQNRYEGDWFTKESIMNVFDISGAENFDSLCSPLAYLCGDYILKQFTEADFTDILKAMCDAEILECDEVENQIFCCFSFDYKFIPAIFSSTSQSLSIFRYLNTGEADLIHIISNLSETWCFSIINNKGIFEKPNEQRLKELLNF